MELFYRKTGQGHPFIILHGLYGASDNWVSIARWLSDYFEVYLIDQRNHGQSPHSPIHNYQVLASDLFTFMENLNLEKAIIMGHSMGGKTAMFFAIEHPEKISRLIIVDISPLSYVHRVQQNTRSFNHYYLLNALKTINLSTLTSRDEALEQLSEAIPDLTLRQFLLKNLYRNRMNIFAWKINIDALYSNMNHILDGLNPQLFDGGLGLTGFPILFIAGEKSDYITKADIEAIDTIFPNATLNTVKNAGHWLHAENPKEFIKFVHQFVLA